MKNELLELTRSLRRRLEQDRVNISDYTPPEPLPSSQPAASSRTSALRDILVLGEGFDSAASALLDKILAAIGLSRAAVAFAEPAGFEETLETVQPKVILTLGLAPARKLLGEPFLARGQWREYKGAKLLPTLHPSELLRDESLKKDVWADMKALKAELGL